MNRAQPVSLKQIAGKAGCSRMTVSLALRDDARIPVSTRKRIRKIADQLGFTPNPRVARAMAAIAQSRHARHHDRIVFLTSHASADDWRQYSHEFRCYQGALERARVCGYSLEPIWALDPKLRGPTLSRMLWTQGIEGVLLAPLGTGAWTGSDWKLEFDWHRFSVVETDEILDAPIFHSARHDHFHGMLLLLESMERLGYRRIGLVMDRQLELRTRHRWYSAWLLWRNMRGFDRSLEAFFFDQIDEGAFRRWAEAGRVDGVVAGGEQLYEQLCQMGFRIPAQLGLGVLDRPSEYGGISLSGIDQNAAAIGAASIDLLVGLIHRGERGVPKLPAQWVCEGVWVNGRTTRKIGPPLGDTPVIRAMVAPRDLQDGPRGA